MKKSIIKTPLESSKTPIYALANSIVTQKFPFFFEMEVHTLKSAS